MPNRSKQAKPGPRPYPYIWAWGELLGSFAYYCESEAAKAAAAGAPQNAVYAETVPATGKPTGNWITADQVQREDTRAQLELLVKKYQ